MKIINQKVEFKDAKAGNLFDMFLDSKHHSAIRGGIEVNIQPKEGAEWIIDNGHLYGKILEIVTGKLIVLCWRSAASTPTPEDLDMIVLLRFEQNGDNVLIELTHCNVPENRFDIINKSWHERYWEPWKKYAQIYFSNQ
ncbi:MAG: SRPBCC domain-containing protein [Chitinophagaceae bacterium]